MSPSDQSPAGKGKTRVRSFLAPYPTAVKVMMACRVPKPLYEEVTAEAKFLGMDLTTYVNRLFDGVHHHFALPSMVSEVLERDRAELDLGRYQYLQYVLFRRYEAVAKHGSAFDKAPENVEKEKRK